MRSLNVALNGLSAQCSALIIILQCVKEIVIDILCNTSMYIDILCDAIMYIDMYCDAKIPGFFD